MPPGSGSRRTLAPADLDLSGALASTLVDWDL